MASSTPVTIIREEVVEDDENPGSNYARVPYIRYPINFKKKSVMALFDLGSKINVIFPTFAKEGGLLIRLIDIGVQKIDGIILDTYRIVVAALLVIDKANQI